MSLHKPNIKTQSTPSFHVTSHGISDIGRVRKKNEDSILLLPEESTWVVADGMGGHHAGDFASQTITQNMGLFKQQSTLESSITLIEENLLNSNSIILQKAKQLEKSKIIGSTVVSAYIWGKFIFSFWAGDSRLYCYRDNQLKQITSDHSYVAELVKMRKIKEDDAESHPASNIVSKAVGIDENLRMDLTCFEMQANDIYILCSDGLCKDLVKDEISAIIKSTKSNIVLLTQELLNASLNAGGSDNTSIIIIKITQ